MRRLYVWTRRLLPALAIGALLPVATAHTALIVPPTIDATAARAGGSVSLLDKPGFGDRQNSYAWAMAWFKGKLYVGTGRDVLCVETATSHFYFSFSSFYTTNPAPGVHCAKNEYDLDLRAEIWQYTPQTATWRMVYRSPADIRNPRAPGKFVARDIAYRGMRVVRDSHGRQALFVSGVTADEYIPELARRHPPRLLRTFDGTHFHDIAVPLIDHYTGPFVDRRAMGFRGLTEWSGHLYVVGSSALTGDGVVFEVLHPFAAKAKFVQVSPPSLHVFEMDVYDNHLYVGTGSFTDGYGVFKTPSTTAPRRVPYRLTPVVTHGAGWGTQMVSVVSMHPFHGYLYVGAVSWYSTSRQGLPASELIRIGHRDQWDVVAGNPRRVNGQWRYPISGLPAGFGNPFNSHLWRITDSGGALLVGTLDWSWLLQNTKAYAHQWAGLVDRVLKPGFGFDLWKSCNGVSWAPMTINAFGADPYDFGVRTLEATPDHQGFSLGTANHAHGTRIWLGRGLSTCPTAGARPARSATQPPQNLLTDVQAGGTVLSWEPSPGAVGYRVERAGYVAIPLSLEGPPISGSIPPTEDSLPQLTAPGTPGSVSVDAQAPGPFETLGTTAATFFVDRTRAPGVRYLYRVVAEMPSGVTSAPSNLQLVPDPRPPATFGQLERAAGGSGAVAAIAASRHAGRRELARLGALARSAANEDVRLLAYRLERRLQYAGVAARAHGGG